MEKDIHRPHPPRSGEITYKSASLAGLPAHRISRLGVALADRVHVIDHGTIVFAGTPAELRASHQVTATYLGVGG